MIRGKKNIDFFSFGSIIVEASRLYFSNGKQYEVNFNITINKKLDFLTREEYIELSYNDIFDSFEKYNINEDFNNLSRIHLNNNLSVYREDRNWKLILDN